MSGQVGLDSAPCFQIRDGAEIQVLAKVHAVSYWLMRQFWQSPFYQNHKMWSISLSKCMKLPWDSSFITVINHIALMESRALSRDFLIPWVAIVIYLTHLLQETQGRSFNFCLCLRLAREIILRYERTWSILGSGDRLREPWLESPKELMLLLHTLPMPPLPLPASTFFLLACR